MEIYADNAATTRLSPAALEAMLPYLRESYGNPSSLHSLGREAARALWQARETVAEALGCSPGEISFTSGGSESDNQALLSAAMLGDRTGRRHIISWGMEHAAVLKCLEKLAARGFEISWLPARPDGIVRPEELEAAMRPETLLVTVMYANNEVGTIQPIEALGRLCRERGVLMHTDAVQAVGRLPVDVKRDRVDMLSLSAHKFHGPKGIGALYARRGTALARLIEGGAQERGRRAGTENVAAIVGMAAALRESCDRRAEVAAHLAPLRDRIIAGLERIPGALLCGDRHRRLPGHVNMCFEGVEGEALLLLLDRAGICASSGAACASGSLEPSHVLLSMGLPPRLAKGSLRLSLGEELTQKQADYIIQSVTGAVARLRGGPAGIEGETP